MEKRRLGRSGHLSTVAIFGAACFWEISQKAADRVMEQVIAAGINHIDVAPSYGQAEERIGPWMTRERDRFFVGCKTTERGREGAAAELRRSLERLHMDRFDLYQLHAVGSLDELDRATGPGGALEAVIAARDEGLTRCIGITGHGVNVPAVMLEALRRFDFDTVLFPINFVQFGNPAYRRDAEELLRQCHDRDVGTMIIKSITRGPWGDRPKTHTTWYEPFTDPADIQRGVNFALSQDVSGLCTVGDVTVLPLMIEACERFQPLSDAEQAALIEEGRRYDPLFA